MKRIELFEFEDYSWLPAFIRRGVTGLIMVLHRMTGSSALIAKILSEIREKHDFKRVVDMGSGSGGPMPEAIKLLNKNSDTEDIQLLLSDLHPNPNTIEKINQGNDPNIKFHPESLNATDLAGTPQGIKTMIASFHHMRPEVAKKILTSAEKNKQAFFIYEIGQNTIPTLLWWIALPLSLVILFIMSWIMTPFAKNLSLKQLLFTYIIPIIPLVYAWDGQASIMRTYTFSDIKSMIGKLDKKEYIWNLGPAINAKGKKQGYFIYGIPKI